MTDQRWQKLIESMEDDHKIESRVTENLEGRPGTIERLMIKTPVGRFRLSRTTEPKRLAEKTLYSKRGSSTASIQQIYDETEQIHVFSVENFSATAGDWVRLDPNTFNL